MRTIDNSTGDRSSAGVSGAVTQGSIIARLERLPGNALQVRARILIGLATFFDGFDVIAIATTLPLLIAKWHLTPWDVGFLLGSGSIGQLIGAFLFPWYAERGGRVKAIALSSGIIGITSIACGFAPTFAVFVVLRIIQGLGLGGELPVAATYINEISRAHGRGRFVLLYEIVFPIGLLASSAMGAWIVPRFGWPAMYFIGGMPLILFFALRKLVPESPRWLAVRDRMAEADSAVLAFERAAKVPLPPVASSAEFDEMVNRHPKRSVSDLFGPAYLKRTIAVAMLWVTCGFIQYGLSTWLPTIYRTIYHAPLQLALNLAVAASVLGVVGSLVCALLVDAVGRKPIINISFILCAVSLAMAGVLHDSSVYVVATFCAFALGFLASGFITAYVYTPELYPTSIRAMGCGVGGAWLKIAAIFAPAIVSKTMIGGNLEVAFYILAAVPFVAAIAVHFLGIETKGKVLEQLEA
ncbi:MFS transporter [Paraburkholderia sp. Ac-20336]|uniref:MFS transporter n=1 Tax=Burkholderiaceae TaxID=119060 RepID=UPI001420C998|nr:MULTISPECIES: MFS transporter [Burkholderiaceae]MBN3803439.1 MFS transporter [Paraburkholderia sp. Ac-20336]MBN3845778.1 MFS transporter [Paraburkholderia sp. Ac-20342]NIF51666.1 MFS transporter [Burkholderia sp. Ax-1724]NIF76964.1 MFS transporter [Paraburkholderia sp. Cy-641]